MMYFAVFVLLSLFILIHEFGHFYIAKRAGIPIARFSVGIGPALWSYEFGGTEYRLSAIPIGGYVMVDLQSDDSFFKVDASKRIAFALGGPAANLLAACAAFGAFNCVTQGASLYGLFIAPIEQTGHALATIMINVPQLFLNTGQVSGVVGLVAQGGDFVAGSLVRALQLSVVLNLNLAVVNMLPIPPLDGGKVVLYALEKLNGGLARLHIPLSAAGWILILGTLAYVTLQDVRRIIVGFV